MDISLQTHGTYVNKPISSLPTPAFVLSRPIIESNVKRLLNDVSQLGISFRPHVKTLKSIEVTRMMLDGGKHRKIVASTVCEIEGALPLVTEGVLDECLYGLPITDSVLPRLVNLGRSVKILLMIDNEQHVELLERFAVENPGIGAWDVFIKVDVGSHRAGVINSSPRLRHLIERSESSFAVSIHGFYCHAGHSYGCRDRGSVDAVLQSKLEGVLAASQMVPSSERSFVLSIGSTPTAHAIQAIKNKIPKGCLIELHAGNFAALDLQQVCTGLVSRTDQAVRILADVCSLYPERNEALVNAGAIALSRETSSIPGFGLVVEYPDWHVVRLSQEHGILGLALNDESVSGATQNIQDVFRVGQRVSLYCQHVCITAAAFHVYYVVDENDIVRDAWIPWKGW
ncbi:putative serine dehydratase domain-containing protein [Aspergillus pseudotamarii]|uniref:D-serine dehydratase n=1 Tax=Aspergillus pseudotamarii TaxID=132259 RepID=A0A5N6T9E6_ASPPS|nr:putative serine dehydratase domain-containing protein [Aspergillus pseudotamarii]KAE8142994.1 putative serine dehydratase domain-containing protein [Aspergillus pseudotamarii]